MPAGMGASYSGAGSWAPSVSGFAENYGSLVSTSASTASDMSNAVWQAISLSSIRDYQKQQLQFNQKLSLLAAQDAVMRGKKNAEQYRQRGARIRGEQVAAYAAQGVDVNYGTPAGRQAETTQLAGADAIEVENNAWREAFGFKTQAISYEAAQGYADAQYKAQLGQTIATAGAKVGGTLLNYGLGPR